MKVNLKVQKSYNSKTYYQFTLIELKFINTYQVWSINTTFCNIFFQILHEKKELNHIPDIGEKVLEKNKKPLVGRSMSLDINPYSARDMAKAKKK